MNFDKSVLAITFSSVCYRMLCKYGANTVQTRCPGPPKPRIYEPLVRFLPLREIYPFDFLNFDSTELPKGPPG